LGRPQPARADPQLRGAEIAHLSFWRAIGNADLDHDTYRLVTQRPVSDILLNEGVRDGTASSVMSMEKLTAIRAYSGIQLHSIHQERLCVGANLFAPTSTLYRIRTGVALRIMKIK